jgi:amino acid transporter
VILASVTPQVQHAFGDFFGFVNAYTNLINSLASQAILVVLFVDYISTGPHFDQAAIWGLRVGFVAVVTLINIKGCYFKFTFPAYKYQEWS